MPFIDSSSNLSATGYSQREHFASLNHLPMKSILAAPRAARRHSPKSRGTALGYVRNRLKLGYAALKTGSECSFTPVNSASSPVFALPNLRFKQFRTQPRLHGMTVINPFDKVNP
ncbi:hypothetical protein ACMGT0_08995 [Pseudomonas sp. RHF3.3-3]|uniref:hypothetical protein n=1 Tax=Pseudomonas sp. RHF3.3-3 TaxID=3396624 RepID=UPI003A83BA04